MAETFVLRYPASTATSRDCEWVVVDAHGARVGELGRGALAEAAEAVAGRRLVVLVPGAEVLLAAPELPTRSAAKLAKLIPFALEEQLATDVDAMHFASARATANGPLQVAAVERTRLGAWLAELAAAGLAPAAMHPDSLLVPDNPAHAVVLLEAGRLMVRRPGELPLALHAEPLAAALAVAGLLPPAGEPTAGAPHVLLYAAPADWAGAEPLVESLRDRFSSLNVQVLADGVLPLLAAGAVSASPLSLLQGEFLPRQGLSAEWPRWRVAASLLAVLLVAHLGANGIDWWRLRQDEARADQQLKSLAAEALPDIQNLSRLPSVRLAIEGRVRKSRAAVSEGLLGTLNALGTAVAAAPGAQLQSLSYRDGTSELTVDAPDVGSLDRLQEAVRGRGFDAQLQGAAQHEQRFQGHLQLKGPGS
jgi:general secretion pathway protein L